jgi:hypothetical protein
MSGCDVCCVVQDNLAPTACIDGADRVQRALQTLHEKGLTGSVKSLPHILALMSIPCYRRSILEGAIASIGGVDQTLSSTTADALVALVMTPAASLSSSGAQPGTG